MTMKMHSGLARRAVAMAATAVAVLGLAACAVGPDYHQPQAEMPKAYQHAAELAQVNAAREPIALDTWWNGFNDPILSKIVQRALDENLDMAASLARVEQARAAANFAGAELLPQGNAYGDVSKERQSLESPLGKIGSTSPSYKRGQTLYSVGAAATWEIDIAGGLRRGAEAADAELQAAEANHLGVRITVAAEAADAYFRIRGAQARIAIARQQVETNQRLLDLVRLRLGQGIGAEREQAQAEALLAQTKVTIPPLQIELDTQLNRLDLLMGAQPGTYAAELRDSRSNPTVPQVALAEGPASLLQRRPDVIAAERRLAASNARIGVATAEYYPKVSLSALLGFESLSAGKLFSAQAFQPAAAAGLRWRLFDFGRVNAEVAGAKGAYAEALAIYRKSMLQATADVEDALIALTQLDMQSHELDNEVNAHQRARDASEEAYKGGAVSLYEVLDEDRQLLASRDQQAKVKADNARAAVSAFRALGGGWS